MAKLSELINNIENAIANLDVNPHEARGEEPGQWLLVQDFLPVYIDAWEEKESTPWNYIQFKKDKTVFQAVVPVCYAPTVRKAEFMEEMLTVNFNLMHVKIAYNASDNIIALNYRINGDDFDSNNFENLIQLITYYAEMMYHVLKDEFHLKRPNVQEG